MRRIIIAVFVIVIVLILFSACRPAQARPCHHTEVETTRPDGLEPDLRGDTDNYMEGLVWVANGQGDEAAAAIDGRAIDLADGSKVASLFNEWHCPGDNRGLTESDLAPIVSGDNVAWQAVVNAADLIELPSDVSVERAIQRLDGFGPLPVQLLGTANHWSAMPGVEPVEVGPIEADLPDSASAPVDGGPSVVAIVDTGFYGHHGVITGAGLVEPDDLPVIGSEDALEGRRSYGLWSRFLHRAWQGPVERVDDYRSGSAVCDVSHGEFIADLMKRVDPDVTLYGFNAFPTRLSKDGGEARCWETSELAVALTVARMEASGVQFDAVNLSLGTYPHDGENEQSPMPALDAQFAGANPPGWAGTVYAASGNQVIKPTTSGLVPVYPANYDSVIAIGALSEAGQWTVWDDTTPVGADPARAYPWVDLVTPGCLLLGRGGSDPDDWQVWSGSSFASPLAAIHGLSRPPADTGGAAVGLDYDDLGPGMVLPLANGPIPDPGHCPTTTGSDG